MGEAKITPLSAEQALAEWEVFSSFIAKALPFTLGRITLEDVHERIADGRMMPFIIWNPEEKHIYAAFCAESVAYPRKRVFNLALIGGDRIDQWVHLYPAVRHIAKTLGFDQIAVQGRPGWKKYFTQHTPMQAVGVDLVEDLDDVVR